MSSFPFFLKFKILLRESDVRLLDRFNRMTSNLSTDSSHSSYFLETIVVFPIKISSNLCYYFFTFRRLIS